MGDRSYTTVCAWPWPGEDALPEEAGAALAAAGLAGIDATADRTAGDGAIADGDQSTGPILAIVDEEANYGIEAYRELVDALHEAGMNVFATNGAGGDYDAEWEYCPAGGEPVTRRVLEAVGGTAIGAEDVLAEMRERDGAVADLASAEDAAVGLATKRLLADPGVPEVVRRAVL